MAMIDVANLTKVYRKKKCALKDITLSLDTGNVVGLFGPNGSGKSTFFKILAGLETIYSGSVSIDGGPVGLRSKEMVSYMSEHFYLHNHYTAKKAIRLYDDFYADFNMERAYELLENFQLPATTSIKSFSKGMMEKLHVLLTISRDARVYLLDEPLGGIDPATRQEILMELVRRYRPESLTIVTTHMITEMESIFDHALYLRDGQLVLEGSAEDLRLQRGKSLNELFLEVCR